MTTTDDFEVSLFLVDMTTRHSLLHKQKHFRDKSQTKLTSNSARLTGPSHDAPIDVDSAPPTVMLSEEDQAGGSGKEQTGHGELLLAPPAPGLLREESDEDEPMQLSAIPVVDETASDTAGPATRQLKRRRDGPGFGGETSGEGHADATKEAAGEEAEKDDSQEGSEVDELFVGASDDDVASEDSDLIAPPNKRQRAKTVLADDEDRDLALGGDEDTKKKLAMDISYEGFAIYGRALCLVISRRDGGKGGMAAARGGAARTVDWITSTQLPPEAAGEP